jgi:hypothetical protein
MKHRGVRVEKETVEKKVHFLVDVDPEFVSLVRHGANQQPFRVIKMDKSMMKGGENVGMIIQSILLPEGIKLNELAAKTGLAWLSEVNAETVTQHGGYSKLTQKDEEEFESGSLNLVKLDDSGTYAMVGTLKEPDKAKNSLALGSSEVEKLMDIPSSPMAQPVAEEMRPNYVVTFGEMFDKELGSLLDVVRGALSQSSANVNKRKKMVMDAVEAFKSFLAIGLDAIGAEKVDTTEDITKEEKPMFKDKEEFATAVAEVISEQVPEMITDSLKTFGDELKKDLVKELKSADPPPADPPTEDEPTASPEVDELTQKVDKLAETVETMANQLKTDPTDTEDEPPISKDDEPTADPKVEDGKADDGTFQGILFQKAS